MHRGTVSGPLGGIMRWSVIVGCIALLSGCGSMVSTKEELQSVGENEGIVFGSFIITVEKGEQNESGWAFLKGQKAGDATYSGIGSERGLNPIKARYTIRSTPGKEDIFVKKLPAGDYQIEKISKDGFTNLEVNLRVNFRVTPKQTNYIGRLTVQFPDRIMVGSRVRANVTDAQQETVQKLGSEEKSVSGAVKALMVVQ